MALIDVIKDLSLRDNSKSVLSRRRVKNLKENIYQCPKYWVHQDENPEIYSYSMTALADIQAFPVSVIVLNP